MNAKALNALAVMVVAVVAGVVILLTSPTFAGIVSHVALVLVVVGPCIIAAYVARIALAFRQVGTWRPPGSRPFRLSARVVPPSLPAGERRAVGTVRGELERGKVTLDR